MSENIDINVGIIKEEISINAANNIVEVNISTAPVTVINPQNYDLSQFTNTSPNPFIRQSSLSSYVPISRIITINGVAQDLSADRSWTIPVPSITGLVPYIGANANVNLGEYELTAGQLTLDTSPTGVATVGTTRWNNTIGSSETTLKGGSVILKNGVDLVARVVNKVTPNATLTKANYTAVRVSGAQGQRLAVAYAQANNDTNSADTLGLVTETIPTNQEGFIITVGQLEGINTTGSLQGESWSDGDVLYLSPTTPGAITNIKPSGITGHIIVIGYVEYAHANNGKIYVKIMNGWELDELHNVYIDPLTLANNNILQYDSSTQLWRNQVLSTGITIGTTAIASGTVGRVLFEGTGNVVQESAGLTYNDTTKAFTLSGNQNGQTLLNVSNTTSGTASNAALTLTSDASAGFFNAFKLSTTYTTYKTLVAKDAGFYNTGLGGDFSFLNDNPSGRFKIAVGASATAQFTVASTGNVLINTTTDTGYRLDINGTARVQNDVLLSTGIIATSTGTTRLQGSLNYFTHNRIASSGAFGFQIATSGTVTSFWRWDSATYDMEIGSPSGALSQNFKLFTAGSERMRLTAGGNVLINTTTDAGFRLDVNGTARVSGNLTLGAEVFGNTNTYFNGPSLNTGNLFVRFASVNISSATKIGTTVYADTSSGLILGKTGVSPAARGFLASDTNYQDFGFVNTSISSGNINAWTFGQRQDTYFGNALGSFQIVGAYYDNTGTGSMVGGGFRVPLICNPNGDIIISGADNSINGKVMIGTKTAGGSKLRVVGLPTSSAGLSAGDIWNDAGTLKIV